MFGLMDTHVGEGQSDIQHMCWMKDFRKKNPLRRRIFCVLLYISFDCVQWFRMKAGLP